MIKEVIELYGIEVKFIKTNRINHDSTIFKDFSHLEGHDAFTINVLPENSEGFDTANIALQDFGLLNFDNVSFFVHRDVIEPVCSYPEIVGNLIVLPSGKTMEITMVEMQTPGVNNLYTFDDRKSVYKLTCKPYDFKPMDELQNLDANLGASRDNDDNEAGKGGATRSSVEKDRQMDDVLREYDALDGYFDEILKDTEERRVETEVVPSVQTATDKKPMVSREEDDVWGQFF